MDLIDAISDSVTQCLLLLFFRKHLVTLDLLKVLGSRLMPAEGVECVDTQRTLKRKRLFGSECRDNTGDFLFVMRQYPNTLCVVIATSALMNMLALVMPLVSDEV